MTAQEKEGQRLRGPEGGVAGLGNRPGQREEREEMEMEPGFEQVNGKRLESTQVLIATPVWKQGVTLVQGEKETEVTEFWQAQSFAMAKAAAGLRGFPPGGHVVLPNAEEGDAELWGLLVPKHKAAFATAIKGAKWSRVKRHEGIARRVKVLRIMPWAGAVKAEAVATWVAHGFRRAGVPVTNIRVAGTTERAATAQVVGAGPIPTFVDGHGCEVVLLDEAPTFYWKEKRVEREVRTAVVVPARFGVSSIELEFLAAEYAIEFMGTDAFMVPATRAIVKGKNLLMPPCGLVDAPAKSSRYGTTKFAAYCFKCGAGEHVATACSRGVGGRLRALPATVCAEQLIAGTLPAHLKEATKRDILMAEALTKSVLPQNRLAYTIVAKMGVAVDVNRPFPGPPPARATTGAATTRERVPNSQSSGDKVTALRTEVTELRDLLKAALAGPRGLHARSGAEDEKRSAEAASDRVAKMVQAGIEAGLESMRRDMAALAAAVGRLQGHVAQLPHGEAGQMAGAGPSPDLVIAGESLPASYMTTPRRRVNTDTPTPLLRKRPSQDVIQPRGATERAGCWRRGLPAPEMSDHADDEPARAGVNLIEQNLIADQLPKRVYGHGESLSVASYNMRGSFVTKTDWLADLWDALRLDCLALQEVGVAELGVRARLRQEWTGRRWGPDVVVYGTRARAQHGDGACLVLSGDWARHVQTVERIGLRVVSVVLACKLEVVMVT
ncbi:hypothetical protein HK101_003125 [Irineochytrium annulatum]|nr:hypothetical protein HK101_003125 [Irineochytrium annulatum]